MTFIIMFAGVVMAIQIPTALERGGRGFSIGFIISQISLLLLYLRPLQDKASSEKNHAPISQWIWTSGNVLDHFIIFRSAGKVYFVDLRHVYLPYRTLDWQKKNTIESSS